MISWAQVKNTNMFCVEFTIAFREQMIETLQIASKLMIYSTEINSPFQIAWSGFFFSMLPWRCPSYNYGLP